MVLKSAIIVKYPWKYSLGGKGKGLVGMGGEESGETGGRGSWRLTCKAVKQINVPTGEHKTHDIRDRRNTGDLSRESSRTNPMHHPPGRARRAPDPTTDSTTFLTPFPFTCALKLPPCVRTFYVRPCGATDAPIFSVTCFLSLSPPYLFIFPFVGRLPEFPSRDTVILRFSSRHDCFQSSVSLSLSFFHKKINRGRFVSTNLAQASSFSPPRFFFLFFFFPIPFRRASQRQRSLILNRGGYIYIYVRMKSIAFDFDRCRCTRSNVSSRGSGYEFFIRVFGVNTAR